jgi:hypothetical protein
MKTQRIFAFTYLVLALGGTILLSFPREPHYQGRSLTSWLQQCNDTPLDETQRLSEAQTAVRAIPSPGGGDGTVTETGYGSDDYDEHVGSPIIWEHCDTGVPLVDETGVYLWPPGTWDDTAYLMNLNQKATRHAQAKIKLQTGGKSGSRLHNLFGFTASATHIVGVKDPPPFNENNFVQNVSVPQQNIVLGSVGTMPATGTLYKILPDDTTVDVTPTVSGMDYYTFNVSESKYHSYYDLYDEQANPGYSFMPYGTNEVGHAFWQFSTEAPSDALQYISTNLTKYLGTSCGFFPSNGLFTLPGQMEFGGANGSANIHRRFYIGFPDLINGLEFTKDTTLTPPDYVLTAFNCVGAARGAGFAADVFALPWDESPQNFGVTLVQMYPGPFDDETDTFYSTAPY